MGGRGRHPLGAGGGLQDRHQKAGPERGLLRAGLPDAFVPVQPDAGRKRPLCRGGAGGRALPAGRPEPGHSGPRRRRAGGPLPAGRPCPGRGKAVRGHGPRQDRTVFALWLGERQAQPLPEEPPRRRGQAGPDRKAPGRSGGRYGGKALRRRHRGRAPHCRAQPLPVVRLRLYLLPRGGQRRAAGQGPGPRQAL